MAEGITRRDVLAGMAVTGATLLASQYSSVLGNPAATGNREMATGVVFNDLNGNGVRDIGEPGIPNVLVSNGHDIVRTDADGRYRISVADGEIIFVIKPSEWMIPLDHLNLRKFYYFHRPTGSPKWRPSDPALADGVDQSLYYPGSKPTGPLPPAIDFPLRSNAEPQEFKIVCFGDTQVTHDRQVEWMSRDTIAELTRVKDVAFGVSVGDLVNVGLLHMFLPLNEMQAKTQFPWYVLPGNHDQNLITPNDELADETFRSIYGPPMYAFEYGPVSFLMLENIMRRPFVKLDDAKAEKGKARPASDYTCGLRDDQWQFVENYLRTVPKDRQLVICMHIPITGEGDDDKAFCKRLMNLISGRPHTLSISGHTHIQKHSFHGPESGFSGPGLHHHFNTICVRGEGYRGMFDELRIPTCQARDGTPNGYSFITFTKDSYKIRYKPSRGPDDYQMNIFVSPRIRLSRLKKEMIRANIFAGSPKSKIRMRVNDGHWLPMELTSQPDPSMSWVFATQKSNKPWLGSFYLLESVPDSHHIWQAPMPATLSVGTHTVEVESTDIFGQVDRAVTLFRVMAETEETALNESDFDSIA